MNPELQDARAELEADGLTVKQSGEAGLWICATMKDVDGIQLSNDASMLIQRDGRWVAIFHGAGNLSYVVPGHLGDLVPLIREVYRNYRRSGCKFRDAFARSVPDPDSYLAGLLPAEDRPTAMSPAQHAEVGGRLRG